MSDRPVLPPGITPRLISRAAAAAYCGMSPALFDSSVAKQVKPLEFGRRDKAHGRLLWDIRALDRWLDEQSGLAHPVLSTDDWINRAGRGDDRTPRNRRR